MEGVASIGGDRSIGSGGDGQPVELADIHETLAKLEQQIAAYRRALAEQDEVAGSKSEGGTEVTDESASPLGAVDEDELGNVAESIASEYVAFFAGLQAVTEAAEEVEAVQDDGVEVETESVCAKLVEEPGRAD